MCRNATTRIAALAVLGAVCLSAQPSARADRTTALDWRRVGNTTIELGLAAPAGGPVDRVWFSADGSRLFALTHTGRVFETVDYEHWKLAPAGAPVEDSQAATPFRPENQARIKAASARAGRWYAAGRHAYRSDDGGFNWTNLTELHQRSIIGDGLRDLAVSPRDPEEVVAAGERGVWRSADGGLTWTGLNVGLPNLPVRRIVSVTDGNRALRIVVDDQGNEVEWVPGEKGGWRPAEARTAEVERRAGLSTTLGAGITAYGEHGQVVYAGSTDARVWSSLDAGQTWLPANRLGDAGVVYRIVADSKDPLYALALVSTRTRTRLFRTTNGGVFWENMTGNLPETLAYGAAFDRSTGATYLASDRGVYIAYFEPNSTAAAWSALKSPVESRAIDVTLDSGANQLYVAFEGYGVYGALAPHRLLEPKVVSAADLVARAAAPGTVLSVIGTKVLSARAGQITAPILASGDTQSQIQVPFDVSGSTLSLLMESAAGQLSVGLPLQRVAPGILVDRDGSPLVMNADTGLVLDGSSPARSNSRLQILATGLGSVRPEWPTGLAAPIEEPPQVIVPVRVMIDREPVQVTRAVLAPGYIGFYLIEVQLPRLVNLGSAELFIEADGQQSNRVRIYLEP